MYKWSLYCCSRRGRRFGGINEENRDLFTQWRWPLQAWQMLLVCCAAGNDTISNAEKAEKNKPGLAKTKAIAEEGFIYGLPIVMNYGVMYEYAVINELGAVQGPVQRIKNEAQRLYLHGHGCRNPEQRHALFLHVDGPARRTNGDFGAGGGAIALLLGSSLATATPSTTAISVHAPPAPKPGDYIVVGPDWKGKIPAGIKKIFRSVPSSRRNLSHPALRSGRHPERVKVQSGYSVQPLSAYLKQPAPPTAPALIFPKITKEMAKTNFFDYLDFALQFDPPGPEEKANQGEACQDRHRCRARLQL